MPRQIEMSLSVGQLTNLLKMLTTESPMTDISRSARAKSRVRKI